MSEGSQFSKVTIHDNIYKVALTDADAQRYVYCIELPGPGQLKISISDIALWYYNWMIRSSIIHHAWMELYLGGVKYRAPYGANNLDKKKPTVKEEQQQLQPIELTSSPKQITFKIVVNNAKLFSIFLGK